MRRFVVVPEYNALCRQRMAAAEVKAAVKTLYVIPGLLTGVAEFLLLPTEELSVAAFEAAYRNHFSWCLECGPVPIRAMHAGTADLSINIDWTKIIDTRITDEAVIKAAVEQKHVPVNAVYYSVIAAWVKKPATVTGTWDDDDVDHYCLTRPPALSGCPPWYRAASDVTAPAPATVATHGDESDQE